MQSVNPSRKPLPRAAVPAPKPAAQPTYIWEGVNRNGVKIRGETQAVNPNWLDRKSVV